MKTLRLIFFSLFLSFGFLFQIKAQDVENSKGDQGLIFTDFRPGQYRACEDSVAEQEIEFLKSLLPPQRLLLSTQIHITHHQRNLPGHDGRSRQTFILRSDSHFFSVINSPFERRGEVLTDPRLIGVDLKHLFPGLYFYKYPEHRIVCGITTDHNQRKILTLRIFKISPISIEISGPYREGLDRPWTIEKVLYENKVTGQAQSHSTSYQSWKNHYQNTWIPSEILINQLLSSGQKRSTTNLTVQRINFVSKEEDIEFLLDDNAQPLSSRRSSQEVEGLENLIRQSLPFFGN